MNFEVVQLDSGVLKVTVRGRLDMDTALKLADPFTFRVATVKAPVVVDMSSVDFIASIGMRLLLKNAKAVQGRGGKMVLFNSVPLVRDALKVAGFETLIPMHDDFDAACQDALAGMTA
jgi:anti-anti-sigma factor